MLAVEHLSKTYDGQSAPAVDRLSFRLTKGETLALLGPSGCGKTTVLRLLAGLESPDAGVISFLGQPVHQLPAQERGIGMVFQDYALFPHLTVSENIAFGLVVKGLSALHQQQAVERWLDRMQLKGLADRYPSALSGGQQQRVAVARALAPEPAILLLDEPFSNLDAQLRLSLQMELKEILQATGQTTILVTHDQSEAFTLADEVLLLQAGRAVQQGTPTMLYGQPASAWVASFLGHQNVKAGKWWPQEAFVLAGPAIAIIEKLVFLGDQLHLQVSESPEARWHLMLSRREWIALGQPLAGQEIPFARQDELAVTLS